MQQEDFKGTLVKLINTNNMSEIQGFFESYDTQSNMISISKSIIVVNRAIADLATTFNEIVQYKYNGNSVGSTLSTPLGPLFNNIENKSVIFLNMNNYIFIPLYKNTDTKLEKSKSTVLKDAMIPYIDSIYSHYSQMADFFIDSVIDTPQEAKESIIEQDDEEEVTDKTN